ncbi:putative RNA-binding protein eif1ad [Coemansia sp. RSA 2599]|nr:putative RNA-binding protein eif1ad [Coemansia sp. RSA 2598]KAJ1823527.1 putative RNA-binding protein eif1ad [Coemansia sp. RSA 2599]
MGRGKYTEQEALEAVPEPSMECPVARVLGPRGQNLHEVAVARSLVTAEINQRLNKEDRAWFTTLVQLPPRFRSVVWVKRGSYILADLAEQLTDKIGGEVAMVMMTGQVRHLKQTGGWPAEYEDLWEEITGSGVAPAAPAAKDKADDSSDEEMDDLFGGGNPNRQYIEAESDEETDEDSD